MECVTGLLLAVCSPLRTPRRGTKNRSSNCFLLSSVQLMRKMPECHDKLLAFSDSDTPTEGRIIDAYDDKRVILELQCVFVGQTQEQTPLQ